ncbi:MAG TPA: protein kinase, partial [Xanthomonadales bacterium]|nr:protein kinase [Xanthomonadales bacterium]
MTAPGRELDGAAQAATVTGLFASAELASGELVAGRFRVEELLGIGGMGVVYRARDEQLGVPVALKLLRPELASRPDAFARFRQEILLARQVSSAHVVRIHDLVQHEGRWLISMDYIAGASLEKLIDDGGAMPPEQALRIARDIAEGLSAAHRRQVVHRDLKPANVLVDGDGTAFISDFGVARSAGVTGVTGSGVVVGTPEYLSPEQARADPVDARSDLYALGLILYEMLAGKLPFPSGTPAETLAQRIVRSPPAVSKARPELPGWIVRLVARLLQLKPQRRFQRAEDVVRAIETKHVPGQLPEGRPLLLALAVAAAVAGVAFVARQLPTTDAPVPAAAVAKRLAPPVVALPFGADPADAPLARALDTLLRDGLADAGSSVDAARVVRTQKQLGFDDGAARRNGGAIAARLGATGWLMPVLERRGARWRVGIVAPTRDGPPVTPLMSGDVPRDALPLTLRDLLSKARIAVDAGTWPASGDALVAFGEGEAALAAGDDAKARAAYARATEIEPRFAPAWEARLALAERGSDAAAETAAATIAALRGAQGRAVERARAAAELAAGELDFLRVAGSLCSRIIVVV